jgi:type VI protein secretion system component VasF
MSQDELQDNEGFWGQAAVAAPKKKTPPRAVQSGPRDSEATTLVELAEPIFQYVCRVNRSGKKQALHDPSQVRADLKNLLTTAKLKAVAGQIPTAAQPLPQRWKQVEPVLVYFIDFMIRSGNLPFAGTWDDLAYEMYKEMAGDEKFFDLLDQALEDRSDMASERIAVFYTCIGLGFTGFYTGQPEYLRKKMLECSSRIRQFADSDAAAKICPEAYENVNTANLVESPQASLVGIVIALVGLIVVLFVASGYSYQSSQDSLRDVVRQMTDTLTNPTSLPNLPEYVAPANHDGPSADLQPTSALNR